MIIVIFSILLVCVYHEIWLEKVAVAWIRANTLHYVLDRVTIVHTLLQWLFFCLISCIINQHFDKYLFGIYRDLNNTTYHINTHISSLVSFSIATGKMQYILKHTSIKFE